MKKHLVRLLKIALGVEIFWLAIGNILLNSDLGPRLASFKADKFAMTWDGGWTPYPAKLVLNDVRLKIVTWSTETEIIVDRVEGKVRILPFIAKRAVIDNLYAGSATVRINREKPAGERPAPTKPYPGMTIDIREASVGSVERFVFNRFSVSEGHGSVRGSVRIRIRGDKVIEGVEAEWLEARLQVDDVPLPETVDLRASGGMSAFNPRQDKGVQLAEKVTGRVRIDGEVGTLVPLKLFFPEMAWIEKIDGSGAVSVDAILQDGRLQQGTVIDVKADDLLLEFLGYVAEGTGRVDGSVTATRTGRSGEVRIVFDDFSLARRGIALPLVEGENLVLRTRSADLGLVRGISDLEVALEIPDSEVADVTVLNEFLPPSLGIAIDRGSARMQGEISVSGPEREASASLAVRGEKLGGRFRDTAFQVDLALDSNAVGEQLDDFRIDLAGTRFRLFNGLFDNETVEVDQQWWMNIDVPKGTADLSQPFALDADLALSMKDTRAIIALFAEVREWISRFDGFLTVQDVTGTTSVSVAEKSLRVRDLAVRGDRLDLVAEVSAGNGRNDALVWGKLGIFSGGFERVDGETKWKLIDGREWFDRQKRANWAADAR